MNRLVRSSSGFHWWAWRLCWNVWWWWWVGGSSLSEGLWNVLALLGAERSEHSNIMDIRSTQVNVPYNWVFFMHIQFFCIFFFQVLNLMTMKVTPTFSRNWFFGLICTVIFWSKINYVSALSLNKLEILPFNIFLPNRGIHYLRKYTSVSWFPISVLSLLKDAFLCNGNKFPSLNRHTVQWSLWTVFENQNIISGS